MTFNLNELASEGANDLVETLPNKVKNSIHGIGTDIASVERMKLAIDRSGKGFLDRVFSKTEQEYAYASEIPFQRFAACWAMKEAAVKALGTGFRYNISFQDLELLKNEHGQPSINARGQFRELMDDKQLSHCFVSISHDASYAIATVLIL